MQDVLETVSASNLHAAPGNDGIPSIFYKVCWDTIGLPLTEVPKEIFACKPLTASFRISMMVLGQNPRSLIVRSQKTREEFLCSIVISKLLVVLMPGNSRKLSLTPSILYSLLLDMTGESTTGSILTGMLSGQLGEEAKAVAFLILT